MVGGIRAVAVGTEGTRAGAAGAGEATLARASMRTTLATILREALARGRTTVRRTTGTGSGAPRAGADRATGAVGATMGAGVTTAVVAGRATGVGVVTTGAAVTVAVVVATTVAVVVAITAAEAVVVAVGGGRTAVRGAGAGGEGLASQ